MNIAICYSFSPFTTGYLVERALVKMGHTVTYVGLPHAERPGYHNDVSVDELIGKLQRNIDLFLWIESGGRHFPPGIEKLSIPTVAYIIDVHLGKWRTSFAKFFDAVFVSQKESLDVYREAVGHEQVYWLPLGYSKEFHRPMHLERIYDVGFIGNVGHAHAGTPRARHLQMIRDRFKMNDISKKYTWEELCKVYNQSRIVFNASTSTSGDVSMRIFEGTACGALVLTDSPSNGLGDLFRVGEEVVVYGDDKELAEKISYFLSHEKERAKIAKAGQLRALSEHSFADRVTRILDVYSVPGFRQAAPMRSASPSLVSRELRTIYTHLHMVDGVLDVTRQEGAGFLGRSLAVLPGLIRRLLM